MKPLGKDRNACPCRKPHPVGIDRESGDAVV
jgi:hypothetical protein